MDQSINLPPRTNLPLLTGDSMPRWPMLGRCDACDGCSKLSLRCERCHQGDHVPTHAELYVASRGETTQHNVLHRGEGPTPLPAYAGIEIVVDCVVRDPSDPPIILTEYPNCTLKSFNTTLSLDFLQDPMVKEYMATFSKRHPTLRRIVIKMDNQFVPSNQTTHQSHASAKDVRSHL
ncbi:uncharacterized protein EI90DRAFT_3029944 [Cantharellus anzutake]|uniref:uncharacterized protein n=1 Tax=Cantharellus anzutake TaxID=1750568 RepID=UPI00190302E0|nr:uncharacterized protein EI90DRAFT_3029944 [Cantharellus anzutake]KAF8342702.1 hypothetical protein EI90DRAFT_3029944 [Cantharellus anzutake]